VLAHEAAGCAPARKVETWLSVRISVACSMHALQGSPLSRKSTRARLHGVAAADEDAIDAQLRQCRDAVIVLRHLLPPEGLHVEVHLRHDS